MWKRLVFTFPVVTEMTPDFVYNCRYEDYAVVKTTRDSVQEVMQEKINEFSHWQKLHKVYVYCTELWNGDDIWEYREALHHSNQQRRV